MPPKAAKKASIKILGVEDILTVIENNAQLYVESLKEFANIYSSPLIHENGSNNHKMMAMKNAVDILKSIGADVEECYGEFGYSAVPVVLASLGHSSEKKTVLVYCQLDGTGQDPDFPSSAKYIRGRAVMDAASFLIWIFMILAHKEVGIAVPYNIKFCLDAQSRSEVTQLIQVLLSRIDFLLDAEFCIACTSHGHDGKTPDIIYGYRGICDFFINIAKENDNLEIKDQEDNTVFLDMLYMMNSLVDSDGNIAVEGLNEDVIITSDDQKDWFSTINFSLDKLNYYFSTTDTSSQFKVSHIEKLWCRPTIICKGIYPSEKETGLLAGFTVLTVPCQKPDIVRKLVLTHLTKKWKERNSTNTVEFGMKYWAWPWRADQTDLKYRALADSISLIYGVWPQPTMSGAHLPFPAILRKITAKNVLIFTLGSFYDFQLTKDERLSVNDFINGIKLVTRTLHFVEKTNEPIPIPKAKGKKNLLVQSTEERVTPRRNSSLKILDDSSNQFIINHDSAVHGFTDPAARHASIRGYSTFGTKFGKTWSRDCISWLIQFIYKICLRG